MTNPLSIVAETIKSDPLAPHNMIPSILNSLGVGGIVPGNADFDYIDRILKQGSKMVEYAPGFADFGYVDRVIESIQTGGIKSGRSDFNYIDDIIRNLSLGGSMSQKQFMDLPIRERNTLGFKLNALIGRGIPMPMWSAMPQSEKDKYTKYTIKILDKPIQSIYSGRGWVPTQQTDGHYFIEF